MKKVILFTVILFTVFLFYSKVDNTITNEDIRYIKKILVVGNISKIENINELSLKKQVDLIKKVQESVLNISPSLKGIPLCQLREPKQLYYSKFSSCSERSRTIEKVLRYLGFKTRHISIYKITNEHFGFLALFKPKQPSHAVSEVFTKQGWILIDSNSNWVAENYTSYLTTQEIYEKNILGKNINWKKFPPENILNNKFLYIYGLYSRHGKFYPPYNFIPDIEWNEFIYNFTE